MALKKDLWLLMALMALKKALKQVLDGPLDALYEALMALKKVLIKRQLMGDHSTTSDEFLQIARKLLVRSYFAARRRKTSG